MLETAGNKIRPQYVRLGVVILVITIILLSIAYPYLVTERIGLRVASTLKTRWLAYFLATGLLIHECFGIGGTTRGKRVASVLVASVVCFLVLSWGSGIA
jgi:hypothetical protein